MQFTQVAYGGCWKCPHPWQRCSASTPRLAASQKGFVHSFGTGIGLVTLLQSLIVMVSSLPIRPDCPTREPGCWPPGSATIAEAAMTGLRYAPPRFVIVGTSYEGANLALEEVVREPSRVGGLWLMGCNSRSRERSGHHGRYPDDHKRSEERRVGKECRSRWSPYH